MPIDIVSPFDHVYMFDIVPVIAEVKNVGDSTRTFDVVFLIEPDHVYNDTATANNLLPGSTVSVTFRDWEVEGCPPGFYFHTRVITLDSADINPSNDTLEDSVFCVHADCWDVLPSKILSPPDTLCPESVYTPSAMIRNMCPLDVYFPVQCNIPHYYHDGFWLALGKGETKQVEFKKWKVPSYARDYRVCVITDYWEDIDRSNDTLCKISHTPAAVTEGARRVNSDDSASILVSPNPLRGQASISYEITRPSEVKLSIYDAAGRLTTVLVNERQLPGPYSLVWSAGIPAGGTMKSGTYFCRLETQDMRLVRRVTVIR
jgi:hypothetical protein